MEYGWVVQTIYAVYAVALGLIAYLLRDLKKSFEDKVKKNSSDIESLQRDLSDLKSDLPFVYVMREDFVRAMATVEVKLDKIYDCITKGGVRNG